MIGSRLAVSAGALALMLGTLVSGAAATDPALSSVTAFEFVPTGRLANGRIGHTATLLHDGRVLVIGGYETATAEVWDPLTGEWSLTGSMAGYREGHRATLLEDGRVVVRRVHRSGDDVMPAPEVWDPTTGTFGSAGSLADDLETVPEPGLPGPSDRDGSTRTRLPHGRVLITGGWEQVDPSCSRGLCSLRTVPDASIWDPATGITTEIAPMSIPRAEHTATLLSDDRVLVVGGHAHSEEDRTAEILQPVGFVGTP